MDSQGVELMSVPSIWYEFSFVLLPSDCAAVACPTLDVALTPGAEFDDYFRITMPGVGLIAEIHMETHLV